jgi:predicted glycoside hydrolase/deacetylase ChbG (UPF0249 family)
MLIINADDFGRSAPETDVAVKCYQAGRITSVSAMVFMADSERAAELVKENQLDAGLHLNFSEKFTERNNSASLNECQNRLVSYLRRNRYSQVLYNPLLRREFAYSYEAQLEEFTRSYGKVPAHVDGHHHMHLCANLLLGNLIPAGTKVRRNFSFWPGEKSWLNRKYRALVDRWLQRKYRLPDYFFDLTQCIEGNKFGRVTSLAKSDTVELMTHPILQLEFEYLMSDEFFRILQQFDTTACVPTSV